MYYYDVSLHVLEVLSTYNFCKLIDSFSSKEYKFLIKCTIAYKKCNFPTYFQLIPIYFY